MARRTWSSLGAVGVLASLVLIGCGHDADRPALSASCRAILERSHPGLADHLTQVPIRAGGTTVWIAQSRASLVVIECASMVSPTPMSYEVRVGAERWAPGGQELIARGGDVLQSFWFDVPRGRPARIELVRNGRRVANVPIPNPVGATNRCAEVRGDVRLVSCTWIDIVEWELPPSQGDPDRSPIDVVVRRVGVPGGRALQPFWLLRRTASGRRVVLRFGVGHLVPGTYRLSVRSEGTSGRFTVR